MPGSFRFNHLVNALTAPHHCCHWTWSWHGFFVLEHKGILGKNVDLLPYTHLQLKQDKKVWLYFFALPGPQQIRKSLGLEGDRKLATA